MQPAVPIDGVDDPPPSRLALCSFRNTLLRKDSISPAGVTRTCQSRFENLLVVDVRLEHSWDSHLPFRKSSVFHLIRVRKRQLRNWHGLKHSKKQHVFNSNKIQRAWSPSTEPGLVVRRYHELALANSLRL